MLGSVGDARRITVTDYSPNFDRLFRCYDGTGEVYVDWEIKRDIGGTTGTLWACSMVPCVKLGGGERSRLSDLSRRIFLAKIDLNAWKGLRKD